jgi:hypothetical protein
MRVAILSAGKIPNKLRPLRLMRQRSQETADDPVPNTVRCPPPRSGQRWLLIYLGVSAKSQCLLINFEPMMCKHFSRNKLDKVSDKVSDKESGTLSLGTREFSPCICLARGSRRGLV